MGSIGKKLELLHEMKNGTANLENKSSNFLKCQMPIYNSR